MSERVMGAMAKAADCGRLIFFEAVSLSETPGTNREEKWRRECVLQTGIGEAFWGLAYTHPMPGR